MSIRARRPWRSTPICPGAAASAAHLFRMRSLYRTCFPILLAVISWGLVSSCQSERRTLQEKETRAVSGYLLNNNVWGKDNAPDGWQRIHILRAGPRLSWAVDYNWPSGSNPYAVKCYPSVITGWHFGAWSSDGRLPKPVSALHRVVSGARVLVTNPGVQNVAYDLWFHAEGTIASQTRPTEELMIWTNRFGGAGPLGKKTSEVEIGGVKWELWTGDAGWNVFSFVRPENAATWSLDVKAFVDHLVSRGFMPASRQLSGIQLGTEVFRSPGDARMEVTDYFVDID
jgi:hypothetical protein